MDLPPEWDPSTYGDRLAGLYDTRYRAPDPETAVAFLASLAGAGPALELGVGTGRVALPLQAKGIPVQGVEVSAAMIEQLRNKPGGAGFPVLQGDFGSMGPEGPFQLVFAVYTTFFALDTQERQVACFRRVAERLLPGGRFVLECFVPDPVRLAQEQHVAVNLVEPDHLWLAAVRHDLARQTLTLAELFIEADRLRTVPLRLRYAWPAELDLMGRLAGLVLEARREDWDRDRFDHRSTKHISVYRKPEA